MAESEDNLSNVEDNESLYKEEFAHVEEMLVSSREECIEIVSKYQDLSLQVVENLHHLRNTPSPDSDNFEDAPECGGGGDETRQRYESRISAYHRNQEHQARIVDDLQSRVEEYRLRCAKLEAALAEHSANEANISETDSQNLNAMSMDLETAMIRLEQEKNRCHGLTQINTLLREQLETATEVNQTLTTDIQRLTKEWQMARSELLTKETEWKEEEQTLSQYFTKESNTLLQMWRQVLNFRHDFANLKSHTERELTSFKVCICNSVQNVEDVTNAIAGRPEIGDTVDHTRKTKSELEIPRLHDRICELIDKNDRIQKLLDEKEKANSVLCSTVEKINDSISKSVLEKQSSKKEHHFESLCKQYCKIFEDLSNILLSDGSVTMSSLFMSVPSTDQSSSEDTNVSKIDVIQLQSLVNAVRTALQKYRRQLEESNLEISSLKDQSIMQERTVEFLEDERQKMQQLNSQLSLQFESVTQKMQNFVSELKSDSSVTSQETTVLETVIRSLRDEVDNLRAEKEVLLTSQTELRLKMQAANQEARILKQSDKTLRSDLSRSTKKIADLEMQLETLQKDYQTSEDKINQLTLSNELIEQEKKKFSSHLSNVQTQCLDFQSCVTRLREEAMGVKDSLASLQLLSDGLSLEKEDLKRDLDKALNDLEFARTSHSTEKIDFEREKVELRLQLDKLDRSCVELLRERDKLTAQLQLMEDSSSSREDEKNTLVLKNNELTDQVIVLNSQKQNLESDLAQLREELSRQGDLLAESHGERRTLARTVSELESRCEAAEDELKKAEERLAEAEEALRKSEAELRVKEELLVDEGLQLEKDEVDREARCAKCVSLQDQLAALQSLHEKCSEELAGEKHAHLLRLQQMEEEFQTLLQNERKLHNVDIELLTEEKTALRSRMVSSIDELFEKQQLQQDELLSQHQEEVSQLKKQISDHAREYEEKSVQLKEENKKMHSLYKEQISSLEQEIEALQSKLADSEEWIGELKEKMATAEQENQDSRKEDAEQLKKLKDQINILSVEHTNEIHNLENKIKDLKQEKESMQYEVQRMELQLTELNSERNKLVKELDEKKVYYENEISSRSSLEERLSRIQAQLGEEQSSRDLEQRSLEELRAKLRSSQRDCEELKEELEEVKGKKAEHESTISRLHSKSTELRETLREVERSRQEAKREAHTLKRNLGEVERRLSSTEHEASELLGLRSREEEIQGELRKEVVQLKQKLMESSATHEATSKELAEARHRSMELEHQLRVLREQHQGALRECLTAEQGLSERRLGLERSLAETSREIQVLGTRLHAEEGKVLALESKVVKLDGLKRDAENRLLSVCHLLRSALGTPDSGVFSRSTRGNSRERLTDSRGSSPHRGGFGLSDLDVDLIKTALMDHIERASAAEKERDDLKDVVHKVGSELESVRTEHSLCITTIFQLKRELKVKTDLENEFSSKLSNIHRYEEMIRNLEREKRHLSEKAENAEFYSTAAIKEKENFTEKLSELKKSELKLNKEISSLTLEKESSEHRAIRLLQGQQSLEFELATLRETLTTKEQKLKSLEQKVEAANKKVKSSESKMNSLESTVTHLRSSLEKLTQSESILHQKIIKLNSSLSQSSSSQLNLSEELERRQKESLRHQTELFKAQQENEQLNFRLKNEMLLTEVSDAKRSLSESEKSLQENMQQIRKLQNLLLSSQTQERETSSLLSQLRDQKKSLEDRLKELSGSLRGATERLADREEKASELEKECAALRKFKEKVQRERSRSSEASARSLLERSTLETSLQHTATENEALQRKVQDLQAQLAELEERHSQRVRDFLSAQSSEKKSEERRLKSRLLHAEQLLKVKEKSHKQQVQGLLEQIKVLTDNLRLEQKRWKQYLQRSQSASANISYLHSVLGDSLKAAAGDPGHLLLPEAERLDTTTEAALGDISLTTPSKLRGRGLHMTSTPKAKRKLDDPKS